MNISVYRERYWLFVGDGWLGATTVGASDPLGEFAIVGRFQADDRDAQQLALAAVCRSVDERIDAVWDRTSGPRPLEAAKARLRRTLKAA